MTTRPTKKLGEICNVITKGSTPTTYGYSFLDKGIKFIKVENINNGRINHKSIGMFIGEDAHQFQKRSQLKEGDILFSIAGTIGNTAIVSREDLPANINQAISIIRGFEEYAIPEFMKKILSSQVAELLKNKARGGALQNISLTDIKDFEIPLPPLDIQKAIVTKLDEAFAEIDQAITLTEESIAKTEEFKKSLLDKVFANITYKEEIRKLFKIKSGEFMPKKNMIETGEFSVYGGNGVNGKHNQFNLNGENIIIGRVGALCGNVRLIKEKIWLTDNAFYISEYLKEINKEYLKIILEYLNLGSTANQMAQPVISYKSIEDLKIPFPPLSKQAEIVSYLDQVFAETSALKSTYETKLSHLKELKASILQSAFEGKLI